MYPYPICITRLGKHWIDPQTSARTRNMAPADRHHIADSEHSYRVPLNTNVGFVAKFKGVSPWVIVSLDAKITPLGIDHEANKNTVTVDLARKKPEIERELRAWLGTKVKLSAELDKKELQKAFSELFKTKSPGAVLKALGPTLSFEKDVSKHGVVRHIALKLAVNETPYKESIEFVFVDSPMIPHLSNHVRCKLEIEVGIGPGTEAWKWLIKNVGKPAVESLIELGETAAELAEMISAIVMSGEVAVAATIAAAIAIPVLTLYELATIDDKVAEEEKAWRYADGYVLEVYGIEKHFEFKDHKHQSMLDMYFKLGKGRAIEDARNFVKKTLAKHSANIPPKRMLEIYGQAYRQSKHAHSDDEAAQRMLVEVRERVRFKGA